MPPDETESADVLDPTEASPAEGAPDAGRPDGDGDDESVLDAVEKALAASTDEPAAETETETPAKTAGEAGDGKATGAGEAAKPDAPAEPSLEPPEGITTKARERFEQLATGYSDLKERFDSTAAEAEQLRQDNANFAGVLADTGASGEELGQLFLYSKLIHSDDPENLEQAYTLLQSELKGIALRLGKTDDVDLLSEHEDLRAAVENLDITPELAKELALQRGRSQQATARTEQAQAREQASTAQTRIIEDNRTALNNLSVQWQRTDAEFARKYELLVKDLPHLVQAHGGDTRALVEAVTQRYELISEAMAAAAPSRPRPSRQRQALSAGSSGGTPPSAPAKTTGEAVDRALGVGLDG